MRFIGWILLIAGLACATFGAVAYLAQKGEGITLLATGGVLAVVGLILGAMGGKGQPARATSGTSVVHHHHHDDRYDDRYRDREDDEERQGDEAAEDEAPADDGGGDDGGGDDGGGDDDE